MKGECILKLYKKIVTVIIAMTMLMGLCPAVMAASDVGYELKGTYNSSSNTMVMDVYVHDIDVVVGRLALSFDTSKLELANSSTLSSAVRTSGVVTVTTEGLETSQLISQQDGYIMFAWYSSSNHINALSKKVKIASITFNVKTDGTSSFDWSTVGVRYVDSSMIDKWKCGALMRSQDHTIYTNTSTDDDYLCNVDIEYPNCDREPDTAYNVNISLLDSSTNRPTTADLVVANKPVTVSADGTASIKLINGVYAYRATKANYGTKQGTFTINGHDINLIIIMEDYETIVRNAKNKLEIGYAASDNASRVTQSLYLPTVGDGDTSVSWESSDPNVISNTGFVQRQDEARVVVLTASISKGSVSDTKEFEVTALSKEDAQTANEETVNKDLEELGIGYAPGDSERSVTVDVTLKTAGRYGSTIIWESDRPDVISTSGEVVRPNSDTEVTLTATASVYSTAKSKTFTVNVRPKGDDWISDADAVGVVYDALEVGYEQGDSAISVTKNLDLPTIGANGVTIKWSSSDPNIITTYGTVIRQAKKAEIVFTAEITRGGETRTKQFPVTVTAKEQEELSDTEAVQSVLNSIDINYSGTDSAEGITADIGLPTAGADGVTISWSTDNDSVITAAGKVTRPPSDTTVTLTVTASRGGVTATKEFKLTVLGEGATPKPGGNAGGGGGGMKPTLKPIATATPDPENPDKTPEPVNIKTPEFEDLGTVPWAAEAINRLAGLGIINGTSETTFSPTNNIIRGDFITLLVRMLGLESEITDTFDDVPQDMYYYEPISTAKTLGIIDGVGDNKFNPAGLITRQDMIVMTTRALNRLGIADETNKADLSAYADKDSIADYAVSSIAEMVAYNLITGNEKNELCPRDNTTRAEAAVFLDRIYVQSR